MGSNNSIPDSASLPAKGNNSLRSKVAKLSNDMGFPSKKNTTQEEKQIYQLQTDIDTVKMENAINATKLNEEIAKLKIEIASKDEENSRLDREKSSLEMARSQQALLLQKLQKENQDLTVQNSQRRIEEYAVTRKSVNFELLSKKDEVDGRTALRKEFTERMPLNRQLKQRRKSQQPLEEIVAELKTQNLNLQGTIDDQTKKIKDAEEKLATLKFELTRKVAETETRLTEESKKAANAKRILDNERKQATEVHQALEKKYQYIQIQHDQLGKELAELRRSKLVSTQATLEYLNRRADTISTKILKNSKNNNRETYTMKFQTVIDKNDRIIKDLKSVSFTTRLYQKHHEALLKLQGDIDERCMDTLKAIHGITKECKKLYNDYNSNIPDSFQKVIADHRRELDKLDEVNFSSEFAKEVAIQEKILDGLSKEKDILEEILNAEKSNCDHTDKGRSEKPNNLNYHLVIYNMVEANDHHSDIVSFENFMHQLTSRQIDCLSVQRFGVAGKTPRPAKITLKTLKDFEDVLNTKPLGYSKKYGHIRVVKFDPNRKKTKRDAD